jgi:hypothetical protein
VLECAEIQDGDEAMIIKFAVGAVAGGACGFLYYKFIGCHAGG